MCNQLSAIKDIVSYSLVFYCSVYIFETVCKIIDGKIYFLPSFLPYWLTDWLAGWLAGWLADWLTDWLTGWLTEGKKLNSDIRTSLYGTVFEENILRFTGFHPNIFSIDHNIILIFSHQAVFLEKCSYSDLFCPTFSHIRTEYGEILRISPYSVRMWENADQNSSKNGHFLHSASYWSEKMQYNS